MKGGPPPPSTPPPSIDYEFLQLDGNVSLDSTLIENESEYIPVHIGYRPEKQKENRPLPSKKTLTRDNKTIQALTLPTLSNYNMRSLFGKILNFSEDMNERLTDVSFLTEIWEKKEDKKHQNRIEELFELGGIKYISTPRPGAQRGGGVAIAVRTERFIISKLNIPTPNAVEVVWGLLKPKIITGSIVAIILCYFYSPPKSRKNAALLEHISHTLQELRVTHPQAGVIISGDRNSIDMGALLQIDHTLRQTVNKPTRGYKILDVILSNLYTYYDVPEIVPPISPDAPGKGAPSDHWGVIASPHTNSTIPQKRNAVKKIIRPIPESLLPGLGDKLRETNFSSIYQNLNPTQMVQKYQEMLQKIVEETFPLKSIKISDYDQPWFTEELRALKRTRMREYTRHGKSEKYIELKAKFDRKFQNEVEKYKQKIELEVTEGKRGSYYPALKKLGLRPGEASHPSFQLPQHIENKLSPAESVEVMAEYFSNISQEYPPLKVSNLPPSVRSHLTTPPSNQIIPRLSVFDVYRKMVRAKKPNSSVPGDLPKKVVQHYAHQLAAPTAVIFNRITATAVYPEQWKTEYQLPVPKCYPPQTEDDLRNISKTSFMSKLYESFIAGWLLPIIEPYLDPGQCGGLKGLLVTHYLIKLLHFVHSAWDKRQPHAVLAACVDLSKAFNRVDHSLVIQDLYDMHTPSWLLNIIVSYLSNRSMFLEYDGHQSSRKMLPGGGPQGAYLGGLIFIVKYNGAFLRPPVPRHIVGPLSEAKSEKVKFIDDGSVAVSINLKSSLVLDTAVRPKPLNYGERTCQIIPGEDNLLQLYINDAENFMIENKMKMNPKKTQIIKFNKSRKHDFPAEVFMSGNQILDVVPHVKLVGVMITQDLKWKMNTDFICTKARQKLWVLRRLKKFNFDEFKILDAYKKEVRSILEYAVPVWHSSLTKHQSSQIERIQKQAFRIILQHNYMSYEIACTLLSMEYLHTRRTQLCINFAKKDLKKDKSLFSKASKTVHTRSNQKLVNEYKCRTRRFENSSMPYLSKLLNNQ